MAKIVLTLEQAQMAAAGAREIAYLESAKDQCAAQVVHVSLGACVPTPSDPFGRGVVIA